MSHRFGISTHLFHAARLDREHLVEVAAHGFDTVEVYATRTHFDYHNPRAAVALAEWLDDTRLSLNSIHAPTTVSYRDGQWGETLSIAVADDERRRRAVAETRAVIELSAVLPVPMLVLHLGVPSTEPSDNMRAAVARSLDEIGETAGVAGVTLAIELIPNALSTAPRLVQWLEDDLEIKDAGICLDVGHAHLIGEVVDAVESSSGHIVSTHLHDNHGRRDEHLVPGAGSIDWEASMMAFQKVGYDGAWIMELGPSADVQATLRDAARSRARLEQMLTEK